MLRILSALSLAFLLAPVTGMEAFKVRLEGDGSRCSGRVEVLHNGTWGTVCGRSGWRMAEAKVVCRQLGCNVAVKALDHACFPPGKGHIWMDHVRCHGNESVLQRCKHSRPKPHSCHHYNDVGVVCADLHPPSLVLVSPGNVVHPGQVITLRCFTNSRSCLTYNVQLLHNDMVVDHVDLRSEIGYATFYITNVVPLFGGYYNCRYSYQGVKYPTSTSNTVSISVEKVTPVWVLPTVAAAGGALLLIILLVLLVVCLVKRCRSSN